MGQGTTGRLTERRVRRKLEALGLLVSKPVPDRGIDIEASLPGRPDRIARVQVKGRNPVKVTSLRWFQIRVPRRQLEAARKRGESADSAWQAKVAQVDFLILDAVKPNETWVLSQERALELIRLNESRYGNRPDNVFAFDEPLKDKQKEMNLDIEVEGVSLTEHFRDCLENFAPVLAFLGKEDRQSTIPE